MNFTMFKQYRQYVGAAIAAMFVVMSAPGSAAAQKVDCGHPDNAGGAASVQCTFDEETGTLTVIGSGAMADYAGPSAIGPGPIDDIYPPWYQIRNNITEAHIGDGVTSIGDNAFVLCGNLVSVTIANSVTSIGTGAFYGCSGLKSVTIPDGVNTIKSAAFAGAGLTSIDIPNSVDSLGGRAFAGCAALSSVNIPGGVTTIDWGTFSRCSSLTSVVIPDGVTSIKGEAFAEAGLTSIDIPNSVTEIGLYAFYRCTGLTTVKIGSGVDAIGAKAFFECADLTSITSLNPSPPPIADANAFEGVEKSIKVYVPAGSVAAYEADERWSEFTNIQALTTSARQTIVGKASANRPQVSVRGRVLNIRTPETPTQTLRMRMIDVRGRTVLSRIVNDNGAAISLANVPAGRYLVDVRNAGKRVGTSSVVVR